MYPRKVQYIVCCLILLYMFPVGLVVGSALGSKKGLKYGLFNFYTILDIWLDGLYKGGGGG